ncbi:DUF4145 domain-containing protein [Nocardioides sp. LHG3406-4]|uniref:DUF4145 domain-containing protein n=1 Tax=Nocardioides sp. LHG3406-4 TaxID=2804575 RepID=UPI003CE819D4
MTSIICPHCQGYSTFSVVYVDGNRRVVDQGREVRDGASRCNNPDCMRVIGGLIGQNQRDVIEWWPKQVGGKDFPDVPEHIASTADEAHKCLSIGAHRGAIALARAVVEATAKANDITKGMLDKKIDELAKKGVISEAMKEAAHEIRFAGNEVAHADLAEDPITAEDADEVLQLMDAILTRVYQEPAQVERVRTRRQERRGE